MTGWESIALIAFFVVLGFFAYKKFLPINFVVILMLIGVLLLFSPRLREFLGTRSQTSETENKTSGELFGEAMQTALRLKMCAERLHSIQMKLIKAKDEASPSEETTLKMRTDLLHTCTREDKNKTPYDDSNDISKSKERTCNTTAWSEQYHVGTEPGGSAASERPSQEVIKNDSS